MNRCYRNSLPQKHLQFATALSYSDVYKFYESEGSRSLQHFLSIFIKKFAINKFKSKYVLSKLTTTK